MLGTDGSQCIYDGPAHVEPFSNYAPRAVQRLGTSSLWSESVLSMSVAVDDLVDKNNYPQISLVFRQHVSDTIFDRVRKRPTVVPNDFDSMFRRSKIWGSIQVGNSSELPNAARTQNQAPSLTSPLLVEKVISIQ
eukprot:5090616-Pleurochrysis_carterae.AAC.1